MNVMEVEKMNNAQIMQRGLEDFERVQDCMMLAKKENAAETYAKLKRQYISLKALLSSMGVNLTELDIIKE